MRERIRKNFSAPAEQATDGKTTKSSPKQRGGLRLLVRVMIVAAVLLCVVALVINWRELAPDGFVAWVEDVISGTTGGSWPVTLTGGNVSDMQEVGGNLVLLTDTATVYYNSSGGESVRRTCSYAKPLMCVADKYVLLLESGGYRFRLETRSGIELEHTVGGKIVTGGVSAKGDVAVVTESTQSHISEVTVFSKNGAQRYQWLSSEWLAMGVSFSPDGNSLSVVGCRAQNGAMQSTILVFDLRSKDQQPKQYIGDGVLYTAVKYMNSGTVIAVGDKHSRFVNPTGTLDVTVSHADKEIVGLAFGKNDVAFAVRPYGSQDGGSVCIYSASGDLKTEQAIEGEFRDVSATEDRFLALTDRFVYEIGGNGILHQTTVAADSLMTGAIDAKPIVLGLTTLAAIVWP